MKKILLLFIALTTIAAAAHSQDTRVGYANMGYIISKLPDMKQIETDLKSTQTQLRNQIEAKTKTVQQQYTDFNNNMATMADSVRANRQRDLERALAELEQMQADAEVTLQNKQRLSMAPLYLKVNSAIAEVAKENGFAIILTENVSNYPFLLHTEKANDVSDLVLKKFGVTTENQ